MKFKIESIILKTMLISTIMVILTATVQSTKTSTGNKSGNRKSLMEYMNAVFSNDRKAESLLRTEPQAKAHKRHHKLSLKHRHNKNSFRFAQQNATYAPGQCCNSTIKEKLMNISAGQNGSNTTGMLEDWMLISSYSFRNTEMFPPITLPNFTQVYIETNKDLFRVNNVMCSNLNKTDCNLRFYFRLAPRLHIYYAASDSDANILGTISIQDIKDVSSPQNPIRTENCGDVYCFEVIDAVNSNWRLCAESYQIALKWVCRIQAELGQPPSMECRQLEGVAIKLEQKIIHEPLVIVPLPSPHCNDGWNYNKNGADWECICAEGVEQSPIDLPTFDSDNCIESPVKPLFSYIQVKSEMDFTTIDQQMIKGEKLRIQLFEHAFRLFHHNFGKLTTIDGAVYFCEEIIIHTPAEHTIDGKKYDMEIQFVHFGQTKGDIAKQVVLSFLVEKQAGVYNKFFDDLDFFNLPNPIKKTRDLESSIFINKIFYDSESDDTIPLIKPFSFYTYQGSLTSPPCTERTIMYVAKEPIKLSTTVIQLFVEGLRVPDMVDVHGNVIVSDWLPQSNRNTQERNGRPVFCYDHEKYCPPDPAPIKPKPSGHYEKVATQAENYFYVNGDKPSGLPGAFVVSDEEAKGSGHFPEDPDRKKEAEKKKQDANPYGIGSYMI